MVATTIYHIHYPERLTGKVRVRKGFLGRLIPQVEYMTELYTGVSHNREPSQAWRDAELLDILLLGDFKKESNYNYVSSIDGAILEDLTSG